MTDPGSTMTRTMDPIASGSPLLFLLLFLFFFGSRAELPKLRRNSPMSPHTIGRSAEARYQMFPTFRGNAQGRTITCAITSEPGVERVYYPDDRIIIVFVSNIQNRYYLLLKLQKKN